MKKLFKSRVFTFLLGLILSGSVVYAATLIAKDITYDNSRSRLKTNNNEDVTNVQDAIDALYNKANSGGGKTICTYVNSEYGNASDHYSIGTKYECDPGDGTLRNFYILEVKGDGVDLIMDRNITQGSSATTMSWNNAMKYIDSNNLKTTWKDVAKVDLPSAQAIADAVGNSSWKAVDSASTWWCLASKGQDSQSPPYCNTSQAQAYNWLYDYTRECNGCTHSLSEGDAYGYWTRDAVNETTTARAWSADSGGFLSNIDVSNTANDGVRPVITILKSNLS